MQWQTNLPLIAILRGITPDEALGKKEEKRKERLGEKK